jgi:hypothetical protein
MGRRKGPLRVVERYCVVSQAAVDEEAKHLKREVESNLSLSTNDIRERVDTRYRELEQAWQGVNALLASLPDRDVEAIRAILFRDLRHVLECTLSFGRLHQTEGTVKIVPNPVAEQRRDLFSEFLFER